MKTNLKRPPVSTRPPVEALQYEKLALSAFQFCDQQLSQIDTLIHLAASIPRSPVPTADDRRHQYALIDLLIDTAEQYRQDIEHDRHLYRVIALDAKGIARSCITASHADHLLAQAAQATQDTDGIETACEA